MHRLTQDHRPLRSPRLRGVLALGFLVASASAPLDGSNSTSPKPIVIFSNPGRKAVTLVVCNAAGCTTVTKGVEVLDPRPAIQSAQLEPASIVAGQVLRLTAKATGKPPLSYTWRIRRSTTVIAVLGGASVTWNSTGVSAGAYTATLTVQNLFGAVQSPALPFQVTADLPSGFYTLTPCRILDTRTTLPLIAGSRRQIQVSGTCGVPASATAVAANVTAVAPTADGHVTLFPGDLSSTTTSTLNFRAGRTRANNAILPLAFDGSGTLAAAASSSAGATLHLLVDVSGYFAPSQLQILRFEAQGCSPGFCLFRTGQPISFTHQISGAATLYRYDWDGNGTYEQSSPAPVTLHTYQQVGFFLPRLQVTGPSGTLTRPHALWIGVEAAGSSSVGPPSGEPSTFAAADETKDCVCGERR